ncbi:hypothetical protein SAMN04488540_10732 [Ferrimonas sediminum]|uniref:Uncharacterized protein n=1 Tax=Ferrimonas sediminum TaxID=718193 RepID=A0A1G8SWE2_9GAMM|nr:hypothetical protein SAMN04488540_10732 [Ferrimonas sediminum]
MVNLMMKQVEKGPKIAVKVPCDGNVIASVENGGF